MPQIFCPAGERRKAVKALATVGLEALAVTAMGFWIRMVCGVVITVTGSP